MGALLHLFCRRRNISTSALLSSQPQHHHQQNTGNLRSISSRDLGMRVNFRNPPRPQHSSRCLAPGNDEDFAASFMPIADIHAVKAAANLTASAFPASAYDQHAAAVAAALAVPATAATVMGGGAYSMAMPLPSSPPRILQMPLQLAGQQHQPQHAGLSDIARQQIDVPAHMASSGMMTLPCSSTASVGPENSFTVEADALQTFFGPGVAQSSNPPTTVPPSQVPGRSGSGTSSHSSADYGPAVLRPCNSTGSSYCGPSQLQLIDAISSLQAAGGPSSPGAVGGSLAVAEASGPSLIGLSVMNQPQGSLPVINNIYPQPTFSMGFHGSR